MENQIVSIKKFQSSNQSTILVLNQLFTLFYTWSLRYGLNSNSSLELLNKFKTRQFITELARYNIKFDNEII